MNVLYSKVGFVTMSKLCLFLIVLVNINIYSLVHSKDVISKYPKVIDGSKSAQSHIPYVVAALPVLKSGRGTACTGAILTDKWVITAAHCLYKNKGVVEAIVRAAVLDSLSKEGSPNSQERKSIRIVKHEGNTKGGDIALLEMTEPFVIAEYVRSITLAKKPLPTLPMTCVAMGYGFTTQAGPNNNSSLSSLPTSAGDYRYCNTKNPNRVVGEEYVCLVPDDKNQAMSSSNTGGPLVCSGLLVGVQHGAENEDGEVVDSCVGENCTQVYTFAGYFEPWIRDHVPSIPEFQPLPGANVQIHPEYDTKTTCFPCDNWNKAPQKEKDDLIDKCKDDGCPDMNAGKITYPPGYKDCPTCGAIVAIFSCVTIGMLLMISLLFN